MNCLTFLSVIIVVLSHIKYFYKLNVHFDNNGLHLGSDLCLDFIEGHFSVARLTLFEHLSNIINTKVKVAYHNNNDKTVLKACQMFDDNDNDNSGFLLCDNETLNEIDKNYVNGYWSNLLTLWAASKCGFESIILQILNPEKRWPVPKYYGSCGNVMVEKHCGTTLNYFENADWYLRASIALQLLISAKNFTFDHATFQFYLTDVSPYNIAVDSTGQVTHIDLDSLILKLQKNPISRNRVHYSRTEECNDCFKYSASDICASDVSDHNFYAICQLLLAEDSPWPMTKNGLLHSIPDLIAVKYPKLKNMIKMCSKSDMQINRFQAADELIAILKTISEVKL